MMYLLRKVQPDMSLFCFLPEPSHGGNCVGAVHCDSAQGELMRGKTSVWCLNTGE